MPVVRASDHAGPCRKAIAAAAFAAADTVFITEDDGRFVGAVGLHELLSTAPDTLMRELAAEVPVLTQGESAERIPSIALRTGLATLPVVDGAGRFVGAITPRSLGRLLREAHLQDLHHMAGIWHHTDEARAALEASPARRMLFRLPWLLVGLAGSMAAALVVGQFEHQLEEQVAVAFFIPTIVYLADAVGTQSEAVAVRGLSVSHERLGSLLVGETVTGMLIGSVLGMAALALALLTIGNALLAVSLGVAVFVGSSVAGAMGLLMPWLFERAGIDPAFGSGPVGTVVQDLLSLLIYFAATSALM